MPKKVPFSRLTAKQAKKWLMQNDSEEANFWSSVQKKEDLINSVSDNLSDYGIKNQSGEIIITSNQECFQDEFINSKSYR